MIPCKEIKCICYPACIRKRDIQCDLVRTYYHKRVVAISTYEAMNGIQQPHKPLAERVWEMIKEDLPIISSLKGKVII